MPIRRYHPLSSGALAGVLAILLSGSTEAKTVSGIHQEFLKTKLEAVKGSAESQHRLGVLYERGLGIAKDETVAAEWFLRAAEADYAPAQYALKI